VSILNALGGVFGHFNFLDYAFAGVLVVAMLKFGGDPPNLTKNVNSITLITH